MRWLWSVLLVGCYNPTIGQDVPCGPNGECPNGQSCIAGLCTSGDGMDDASTPSDDAPVQPIDAAIDAPKPIDAAPVVMPPQFVAFTSVDPGTNSFSIQVPAGVANGDLLLAHVSCDATTMAGFSEPAGWTRVIERDGVQDQHYGGIFYRRADGTTSYDWTFPNTYGSVNLMAFRNVNMMPIDASDAAVNNDTVNPTAPSITTTRAQTVLVVMLTQDLSNGPFTPYPGMTEVYSKFTGQVMVLGAYQTIAAPGATGVRSTATGEAGPTIGFSVALAPL